MLAATLSGQVFNDLNGDQIWQSESPDVEPALDCWTVFLDTNRNGTLDTGEQQQLTTSNGLYQFNLESPGEYAVELVQEPGFDRTTPIRFGLTTTLVDGAATDHVFDPVTNILYTTAGDRILRTNTRDSDDLLAALGVGSSLTAIDITPDGQFLIVGEAVTSGGEGRIYKIDLGTNSITAIPYSLEGDEGGVFDIAVINNDRVLFTTTSSTNGLVPFRELDLTTDSVSTRSEDFGAGAGDIQSHSRLERNSSRTTMLLVQSHAATGPVHLYSAATDSFVSSGALNDTLDDAHLAISRDGKKIAVESSNLGLKVFDDQFAVVTTLEHFQGGVAFDSVRDIFYVGDTATDELVAVDSNSWSELYRVAAGEDLPESSTYFEMQVNGRSNFLAVTTPSGARFVQLDRPVPHVVTVADNESIEDLDFGNWVNGENRRPIVATNSYSVLEDHTLDVAAPGPLANDFDADGDSLTAQLVTGPESGTFSLLSSGKLQYTPPANYFGSDSFTYRAFDGEYTSCRVATVTITTVSVNDAPTSITVNGSSVEENDPGAEIGTVVVVDPDQTDQFVFVVSDGRFEVVNNILRLRNGQSLNHEEEATVELTITAFDSSNESISTEIQIHVGDVNEFEPKVDDDTTDIEVEEGQSPVGDIDVSDEDSSQTIDIVIIAGNDGGIFSIDQTGTISINPGKELEETQIYVLTISVTDSGDPPFTTTSDITITVTKGNQHDPVVTPATFEIPENSPDGTIVGTVVATDADEEQTLTYAIVGGNEFGAFTIDAATGEITVVDSLQLDREQIAQFVLLVQATDNGSPNRSGVAEVVIKLTNVNEFDPVIVNQTVSIEENLPDETVIAVVSATDADIVHALTYSLSGGPFSIDSETGEIKVDSSSALDMESTQQFVLTVTVTDSESPTSSATGTVTVNLSDVNEFDPETSDKSLTVPEDAPFGFEIGQLTGSDQDFSHTLVFSIVSGNEAGLFTIHSSTGVIKVASGTLPDHDTNTQFVLTVMVSDSGNPTRTDEAEVTISVGPANVPPTANDATFSLEENSSDGTVVGTVSATDPEGSTLTYQFMSPSSAFEIDATTGEITVADSTLLNFEDITQFKLNVRVTDSGSFAKSDDAVITINLTDVNEFAPTMNDASFTVPENANASTAVGMVHASDLDIRQAITYSISNNAFAIHPTLGMITVADGSSLNFESAATITLVVTATDNGNPQKSSTATVTVSLTDQNEASPVTSNKTFNIEENSPIGDVLGEVTATDADSQQMLTFQFIGGNIGSAFEIHPQTGEIKVRNPASIDAETIPQFLLLVKVADSGLPGLSTTSTVTVNVQGVNEAPVAIALDKHNVGEKMKGATIGLVSVTDFDVGDPHTFTVDDSRFTINPNRILKLQDGQELDLANGAQVPIEITATDAGGLSVSQSFVINVFMNSKPWQNSAAPLDVNDDGFLTPNDVLLIINQINNPTETDSQGNLPLEHTDDAPFYDVNGDGVVSPIDALIIINALNKISTDNQAEGEGFSAPSPAASNAATSFGGLSGPLVLPAASSSSSSVTAFDQDEEDDLEKWLAELTDVLADDIASAWNAGGES